MKLEERVNRGIWKVLTPIFPALQHTLLRLRVIRHKGRQPYLLGYLRPGATFDQLKAHLAKQGFGNHFIAWSDTDQILSWRKRTSFNEQYHIRFFKDGEIRGHYEYTPEGHPLDHFYEVGQTERREKFLEYLGDWVVQQKPMKVKH